MKVMGRIRVIVLYRNEPSQWLSVTQIYEGYLQTYRLLPRKRFDVRFLPVPWPESPRANPRVAKRFLLLLRGARAYRVVFLDLTLPHSYFLELLRSHSPENYAVFIHLYGDFLFRAQRWHEILVSARGLPLRVICGSRRQTRLVQHFVGPVACAQIPFPVQPKFFKKNSFLHKRRSLLYAGRISPAKNVGLLLEVVDQTISLKIAGWYDSDQNQLFGRERSQAQLKKLLAPELGKSRFLNKLSSRQLIREFREADRLVSLSTYACEDFGLSIAQALACGTPAIVTDWGGHADFLDFPWITRIPVRMKFGRPFVEKDEAREILLAALKRPVSARARARLQKEAFRAFSVPAIARHLEKELSRRPSRHYTGPLPSLGDLSERLRRSRGQAFLKDRAYAARILRFYLGLK